MSAITAKASRKMKKYAVLTREPRCFLGSFDFSWEQRKFSDVVATRRGLTYKPSDIRKNGVRVLRSSNIAEDSFVLSDEDVFVVREAVNIDCVRANDILITAANGSSRLVGKHTIISGIPEESAVHGGFMLLGTTKEPHFVNASMGSSWYRRFIELFVAGGNGAIGNLNKNDLDNQDIAIPSEKEQKKIGSFFRQLDNLITLHQRKCVFLFGFFQAFISMIFTASTFSWEQRKLGDIADIVGGGTPSTGNQSYWDGDIDWYAPAEIADQIYANSSQKKITGLGYENSSAKMLPPGTVLFTSRAGIGKTAILTRKGCTNQGFQSIVPHRGELDSYFIFSRTEELKRYGELVGAGSTFVEVSGKQMAVMELMMPPTMREQQTIGGFFQQLDHLITLHQRECISFTARAGRRILTANKKRNTSSWEQRKAIDIADYSKGNGYSKGDLADAGTPIILYGRLYTKYQFAISEVDTFAVPRNGAVYSQGNEVIVPASGETAEDIARASAVEKSGVLLGGDLNILRPFDFMNPLFLALAISNGEPQKELAKKAQGKSVVHIHNTDIQEVTIAYPSKTEQDRIVSVFRQLDNLITLHQRKPFLMKWRTSDANRNKTNRLVL